MIGRRLEGKSAVITGAASGIGKATSERLGAEGATLVLADINFDGAKITADEIAQKQNVKTMAIAFDASDANSCRSMIDEAIIARGKLDILCNIAGIMDWGPLADFSDARWERMININLSSVFYICRHAIPHLVESKGNIVNMSSASGLMGLAYTTAYCAAKSGVIAITKSLAVEYASKGVRVNAVCPGGVKTPMTRDNPIPDDVDKEMLMRHWPKLGDMAEPEDVAAAVAYLASRDAQQVTGIALSVDGGQVLG